MTGSRTPTERDPLLEEAVALLESMPALAPGTLLGDRFEIIECIGMGGMGVVYRARDAKLGRDIAVKLRKDDSPGGEARLLGEAQAMAKLSHPNVVPAYELGSHDGAVFIAMELVEGRTVRDWLRERPRSWREVIAVFRDAGAGLSAIHRAGLIYRDFKPDNVLVGTDGRVRIADLGLARPSGEHEERAPGNASGTPAYMSPEVQAGHSGDLQSDQYAFSAALHEALFGNLPDGAREPRGDVPRRIRAVVARGLAADPSARYPSMDALLRALAWDPSVRRRRVALGVVVAALGATTAWGALRTPSAPSACAAGDKTIREGWSVGARAEASKAFLASGRPYAADTWSRVESSLDRYAHRYREARGEACASPSPATEVKVACLDWRATGLVELVTLFRNADAALVDQAVKAVGSLERLDGCENAAALLDQPPLPSDPVVRKQVEVALGRLATVIALQNAGRVIEGIALGRALIEEARRLAYEPLLAKALARTGSLLVRGRDAKGAETLLREALLAAARSKDDQTAAAAAQMLIHTVGVDLQRRDEAVAMIPMAEAWAARAGGLRPALLDYTLGALATERGEYAEALAASRRSLAALEKLEDTGSYLPEVTRGVATDLARLGRLDEAARAFRRSVELAEKELGSGHPETARFLVTTGNLAYERGQLDEAKVAYERARDIWSAALGPEHPMVAIPLGHLALLKIHLGRSDEALPMLQRVLAIRERALGPDDRETGNAHHLIGVALHELGRIEEAEAAATRALETIEKAVGAEHPRLVNPLLTLAQTAVRREQPATARAAAARALAITRKAYGDDSPKNVEPLILVSAAARLERRGDEALALLRRELEIRGNAGGEVDVATAQLLVALAEAEIEFGTVSDAMAHLETALPVIDKSNRAAHHGVARLLLARATWASGDRRRALELAHAGEVECRDSCDANTRGDIAAWLRKYDRR